MAGGKHRALKLLGIAAGSFAVLVAALQLVLNSPLVTNLVNKVAAENIDGTMEFSRIHFSFVRSFPSIRVTVDTLSLTYPHDRFAAYDASPVDSRLLSAGRGEEVDTLARFDRFTAAVNLWQIVAGRIRLRDAHLHSLDVYAHQYDTTANWQLFKSSATDEPGDTVSRGGIKLPWISIGEIKLARRPRIVYTAQDDTLFAELGFRKIYLQGDYKLNLSTKRIRFKRVGFNLDSLTLVAALPADSVSLYLDHFDISNPMHHVLDLSAAAEAFACTGSLGRLEAPFRLDGRIGFNQTAAFTKIVVPEMEAEVAYVPFKFNGFANICDSTYIKAALGIPDCDLGNLWRRYGKSFYKDASDIDADARMDLDLSADGYLTSTVLPALDLRVRIPDGRVHYRPADVGGTLNLDLEGSMDAGRFVKAKLNDLAVKAPGVDLELNGKVNDLLGPDPAFTVDADGYVVADSLRSFLPEDIIASGTARFAVNADARKSNFNTYNFDRAHVGGFIESGRLNLRMPSDTLDATVSNTRIDFASGQEGIDIGVGMDSIMFRKGDRMRARVRSMENNAKLSKVESFGKMVPKLSAESSAASVFFRTGPNKVGLRNLEVGASLLKKVRPKIPRRPRMSYRDTLENDFASSDIRLSLDSSITKYLREWSPYGAVSFQRAFVSSPSIPLRTRISAFAGDFTDNVLTLDTLALTCGTSDIIATGQVKGLMRAISGRGRIFAELEVDSKRINANEILLAMQKGRDLDLVENPESESESAYIVDSLANAQIDSSTMKLIVLPGNIEASIGLEAAKVDYSDLAISPLRTYVKLKDRTLQVMNMTAISNYGRINLDAFYSTKTKSDISAGFDLHLTDISASGIIHMIPTVDDLLPALKSFEGNLGCQISATTQLDTNMNVIVPSLDGLIKISGQDLSIKDLGDLRKVTRLLMFRDNNVGHIENMYVNGVIHDSKLEVFPFELGVDRYRLALEGTQGYDKTLHYHLSVMRSPLLVPFGINIKGTTDKWRVGLGFSHYRTGRVPVYTEQLDTMQLNIVSSIRQIFKKGEIDRLRKSNRETASKLRPDPGQYAEMIEIGSPEYDQLDSMMIAITEKEMEEQLVQETNDILDEAMRDFYRMMEEYGLMTNDEKRQQRKAEAEKRNNERH